MKVATVRYKHAGSSEWITEEITLPKDLENASLDIIMEFCDAHSKNAGVYRIFLMYLVKVETHHSPIRIAVHNSGFIYTTNQLRNMANLSEVYRKLFDEQFEKLIYDLEKIYNDKK